MYLWHIFLIKPFAALSILVCLTTLLLLVSLERRRPQQTADRFLVGFLGLISIYQALRILQSAGFVSLSPSAKLDDAIELIVTVFYLCAAMLLRLTSANHLDAELAMRLTNAAPPRTSRPEAAIEAQCTVNPSPNAPLDPIEKLRSLSLAVGDGAFKLYAYLSLHPDGSRGWIATRVDGLARELGKSSDEINACLRELERAGVVSAARSGPGVTIDWTGRSGSSQPPSPALSAVRN